MFLKYTLPFYYTFISRLKTKEEKISYFFTFILPVLIISFNFNFNSIELIIGFLNFYVNFII